MAPCIWQSEDPPDHFECRRCGHRTPRADIPVLPYYRTCSVQPPRGFGDTLARWFRRLGVKKRKGCGCNRRQRRLNELLPYDKTAWKWRLLWPLLWLFRR